MKATLEELKAFADNLMAVCNHQVSKSRPLSNINVDVVAKQFLYQQSQNKKRPQS